MGQKERRNRWHHALHGDIQVVVANITALNNLRLALAERPEVLLAQKLWASRLQVEAEAGTFGYGLAVSREEPCLFAVCYLPGLGQAMQLPFVG